MNFVAFAPDRPLSSAVRGPHQLLLAVALTALLAGACSGSDGQSDASSATTSSAPVIRETTTSVVTPTSTTTTTAATTEVAPTGAELTGAVEAFWDLYLELGADPAPFEPTAVRSRLEERTTGEELDQLFNVLQGHSLAGRVIRGEISSSTTVLTATDTRAEVRDCYDDTTGLYRVDTGERLDTDNPARHQVVFVLVLEDGTWKVSAVRDEGSGCVVAS